LEIGVQWMPITVPGSEPIDSYDADWFRNALAERGIALCMP
jgi:hypothetical protein